jgi:hypothetical protein
MHFLPDQQKNSESKHFKYKNAYKPNNTYWGLGIENEIYLEFSKKKIIKKTDVLVKQKNERYSLDYYSNYKKYYLSKGLIHFVSSIEDDDEIEIPYLLNSHSFTKTDIYNEPARLYTKKCEENPHFCGETFIETLQKTNPYFKNTIDTYWLFDGDSIEFNSINFFNVSLNEILCELEKNKNVFIDELNKTTLEIDNKSCFYNENFSIIKKNYAFATYMTNSENIGIFNNGTLHYNLTLPTELDKNAKILNWNKFVKDHQKAVRAIQWIEPFYIAVYCSPDPFSDIEGFSKASQRCAVSRYIGVGTYNADAMETGKILTKPINEIVCSAHKFWWRNAFVENNAYANLDEIGMDINFNKHYNHGIELRFIDHIENETTMRESFEFIIYLMDFILDSDKINSYKNPIINSIWNNLVYNAMTHGKNYSLADDERELYSTIFEFEIKGNTIEEVYNEMFNELKTRYSECGKFSQRALKKNNIVKQDLLVQTNIQECCFLCVPSAIENENTHKNNTWIKYFSDSIPNLTHSSFAKKDKI